ncbi:helix-turn-helix transcriptional regulator [candidate division KSB1 bacterium]|nr:helix-turn-helix transcriptional regulator [candidate division KSB1 bacterium]
MSINPIDFILLLGAAQGLFLTLLILHKHGRLYANRFLGGLIGLYSIILLYLFIGEAGLFEPHPQIMWISLGFSLLIPPLHYLYARHLISQTDCLNLKDATHGLPFMIYELLILGLLLLNPDLIETRMERMQSTTLDPSDTVFNWFIIGQSAIYLFMTLRLLRRHGHQIKKMFSSLDRIRLNWLRNMTLLAVGIIFFFALENIFFVFGVNLTNYFTLSSILTAVYVYLLGYLGLVNSEVFLTADVSASMHILPEMKSQDAVLHSGDKYGKSGLSAERAKQIEQLLLHIMDSDTLYTDPNLTLPQLADRLEVSPHNLSQVINVQLNQNFFDLINRYRIDKVKQDLIDSDKKQYTILAIAFDAGFNSKTSFNTIFKRHIGLTPSEFRKQNLIP